MIPIFWMAACLKAPTPVQAPEALPVTVAAVVDAYDDDTTAAATEPVWRPLRDTVSAHGLVPADADAGVVAGFETTRSTEDRLAALGDGVVLLVELAPRFSSQMTGRYRWTVDARVHLSVPGGEGGERTVQVPVFLYYAHEQEQAAAEAAVPVVAREVSALLEEWIR